MSRSCASLIFAFAALGLASCASGPPLQFYTLAPVGTHAAGRTIHGTVQVVAVHIPATLDRNTLVREQAPTHLQLDPAAQWSAPLNEMIAKVLTQDLQARLGATQVLPPSASAAPDTVQITLHVLQFLPDPGGIVHFNGSWSRRGADGKSLSFPLQLEARSQPGDPASQAQAMSEIVGRIADAVAGDLQHDRRA